MYQGIINFQDIEKMQRQFVGRFAPLKDAPISFNFVNSLGLCGLYGKIINMRMIDGKEDGHFFVDLALETPVDGFYTVHKDMLCVFMLGDDGNSTHPDGVWALCLAEEYSQVKALLDQYHDSLEAGDDSPPH
jgi:hypothetical protein